MQQPQQSSFLKSRVFWRTRNNPS